MNCPHCGKETGMTYYSGDLRYKATGELPDAKELMRKGLCAKCGGTLEPYGGLSLRCRQCGTIGSR